MKTVDKAWTAGILDGEGHLRIFKRTFAVEVGNTDRRMLDKLQRLWNGTIYFRKPRKDRPNEKPFWLWSAMGQKIAYPCLLACLPYLVVKKERAAELIRYARSRPRFKS